MVTTLNTDIKNGDVKGGFVFLYDEQQLRTTDIEIVLVSRHYIKGFSDTRSAYFIYSDYLKGYVCIQYGNRPQMKFNEYLYNRFPTLTSYIEN